MGCNCKATEQILKINKKYGHDINAPLSEKIVFKTEEIIKIVLAFIIAVIFSPIFLVILVFLSFRGKTVINFNKILNKLLKGKKNE
jgi:lipopolysaccharide/colanic/teichoic acid biosynthesis glycosyltransferase